MDSTPGSREVLRLLGQGETITAICSRAGWSREQFDAWWAQECRHRLPTFTGQLSLAGVRASVTIRRDAWGIPHITASSDPDLFFGFGFATAQDRLFQLEFLRRKAHGRLAEILGPAGVESDRLARTLGLGHIARREWETLPAEVRDLLEAYSAGVNALVRSCGERLPLEFDLLDYRPEPWAPIDSLAVAGEFRWYLTGRFPVIAIPELVKRALGEGPLYRAFLQGEADDESIVPPGSYPRQPWTPLSTQGRTEGTGSSDEAGGSNNWVLAASRSTTGAPLVASDPHVPFGAVSIWHEVHLHGGSFHVAGVAYAGVPALLIGRNERLAWGITNNISSLRDLYQEKTSPDHPGCFLFDGRWEPAGSRQEAIAVRGAEPIVLDVRSSRNGPIVDDVLPGPARGQGPVSLRWLGAEPCGWLIALLGMNRARTATEFRESTRPWSVPTFNLVFADVEGHIGHQCVGRIPVRRVAERGYRPGWDPEHQWAGTIPFEAMPHQLDPEQGFVVTANNRLAPDDYPYPLSGTWSSGHRARRIRNCLEGQARWSPQACGELQLDVRSGRAAQCVPPLLRLIANDPDPRLSQAGQLLSGWDYRMTPDSPAATLFHVFFGHWNRAVLLARLPRELAEFAMPNVGGLASALLTEDAAGWFPAGQLPLAVRAALHNAFEELTSRLGPDPHTWQWRRLHTLVQRHFLSGIGDLGQLLDQNGFPAPGDAQTVCSTTPDANHAAHLGASYRMVTDLADPQGGLWAVSIPGNSGQPGSPHYGDQVEPWGEGQLHYLSLQGPKEGASLVIEPAS